MKKTLKDKFFDIFVENKKDYDILRNINIKNYKMKEKEIIDFIDQNTIHLANNIRKK